jgi:hypothetical protein
VFFSDPSPSQYMVPLSCTGSVTGVNTSTNNPGPFLPVYPNEVTVVTVPASVTENLAGGISYSYNINQTS